MQLDCWTRKSYGGSFYGEVVNFYNFDAQKPQQLVLAVDEFEHPHTAARLEDRFKKGHQFFGILQEQLTLILIGDVATRFDSTFLIMERLCTLEVAEKLPRFIEQHPTATTNLLPGTHTWKEMEALKDLLKPFYSVTTLLSGDTWTISLLYPLLRLLLPRVLKKDVNFPRLSAAMAKDLERRFAYLDEEDYFKFATLLDPSLSVLFVGPPFSGEVSRLKEVFAKSFLEWKRNCTVCIETEVIREVEVTEAQVPSQDDTRHSEMLWSDFYEDRSDEEENFPSLFTPPPSASQPEEIAVKLSAQFESYCANISTYEHMKPGFDIDLKHHSEYLHKFWRDRLSTVPELSQFALANLCFSGAGVGVERLFSGAAIQAEGRLRVLSNTGLRERTMIASNRDLIE